ncbi:MAG TPA: WecB/TagA/CpsF family glycosyltransferase [Candidatus Acidoferrales bacterium]|jgi:N-acetylglucosaminyldiphosphoundecaprenol N-acetyl-beta-D-mannosaminyltransferase|nr:WecB/TagA/CpsF family glycosyltransferase [Candidatus Acidoferrales bacterium]
MTQTGPKFSVLGIGVSAVQIGDVVECMQDWIAQRDACHTIAVTGMHGIMEAHHDAAFKDRLKRASLVVPDGMPLVWLARLKGHDLRRRVYGPELMMSFCEISAQKGYRHFLYGGVPGVAEKLAVELVNRFPGLVIAGAYSPPFRPVTSEEDAEMMKMVSAAQPDVLWVGLSTPKQERWMDEHHNLLTVPVLVGVGAAFDIHSGIKKQAPVWMRENGLEWFFRLIQEPKRLWRRYILYGSEFLFWVTLDLLGLRKYD